MSDQPIGEQASFHFAFWREWAWVWVLLLPLGIFCWGFPVFIFLSAAFADFPAGAKILLAFGFLGIPGYLVGYIFIYNFMEFVFTRVVFSREEIAFRTPWVIFPPLLATKRIPVAAIRQIRIGVGYGIGRSAVQVDYQTEKDDKNRRLFLPKFKDSRYLQEIKSLQESVERLTGTEPQAVAAISPLVIQQSKEKMLRAGARKLFRPGPGERVLSILTTFASLAFVGTCIWITSSLPGWRPLDAISMGLAAGFTCWWMSFLGTYPGFGQAAIWFLGRLVIGAVLWLYQIPNPAWDTPPEANRLLAQFHLPPVHSTLSEFIFWGVLFLSILFSLNIIRISIRRREIKKFLEE